jgi:hypothetical protein
MCDLRLGLVRDTWLINIVSPVPRQAIIVTPISNHQHIMANKVGQGGDMPPMLDRFLAESLRAGYFNDLRAQSNDRNNHLAAHRPSPQLPSPKNGQVIGVPRTGHEHAITQGKQVTTSTGREQDLAHMGAWTKERQTSPKPVPTPVDASRLTSKLGG